MSNLSPISNGNQALNSAFYDRNADVVARELLGTLLVRQIAGETRIGRIVETEAYLGPPDLAAHSSKGRTSRTEVMFGPPGHAYVYMIYGIHYCVNVVTGPGNFASAVLLRALEPVVNVTIPANGPGRLCRALEIDRRLNGHDLTRGDLRIVQATAYQEPFQITSRPRIGVDYAGEWALKPLRFYITGNRCVSRA
jgi:DNA-3-methyladenine glycosylase